MDQQQQLRQLQELFTNANDILIITREQPTIDGLTASLGLYATLLGLRTLQGKEKRVVLSVAGRQGSQYTLLPFADKIVSELGLRDLVIGVNGYVENSIESVNWYVEKDRLNVVFKANPSAPMQFDLKNLDPFYAGANFDVVVVIDTVAPSDLGNAYKQDPGMYSELPVVNISTHANNTRFGKINIVDSSAPSVCELAFQLTQILRYSVGSDAATLFLTGIADATQNFQTKGAQTDEIISQLHSHNARSLDLNAIRQQGVSQPIVASVPDMPQQQPSSPDLNPYGSQYQGSPVQYPYPNPNMQYGNVPQYPGYPPGYYPPFPPQYPGYQYPQPMQGQYQQQPNMYQSSASPVAHVVPQEYPVDPSAASFDVPSIEHDATQQGSYIPTSDVTGYSHVEPSVYMPQTQFEVPGSSSQVYSPEVLEPTPVTNDQSKVPDFSQAPKFFEGSRER